MQIIHRFFQKLMVKRFLKWAFQWKMLLNLDPSKQAIEICFSHKRDNENYPSLVFNDTKVQLAINQKHLALTLDSKLDFNEHMDYQINKFNKIIGIMKIRSLILSRKSLQYTILQYTNQYNKAYNIQIFPQV